MDKKETVDQEDQRLKPAAFKEAVPSVIGQVKTTGDNKEAGKKPKKGQKDNPHNIGVEI